MIRRSGRLALGLLSHAIQMSQAARRAKYRYNIETSYLRRLEERKNQSIAESKDGLHVALCATCGYAAAPPFISEDCPECGTVLGEAWLK